MNRLKLTILILLVVLPEYCRAQQDYGYPIADPYAATILGTPKKMLPELPKRIRTRELVLELFPGRTKPPIFFYDTGLRCTLAYQNHAAPLVFLIAGTGAGSQSQHQVTMLKALYGAGFHVITLPSPTSANFIVSASESRVPGDVLDDAADLYRAMEAAWEAVRDDIAVSAFHLSGYSLGGTQAAFVARLDEERKSFGFRKVLMINPVVSLYGAAIRIEQLLQAIPGGPARIGAFFNRMLDRFSEFYLYGSFVAINDEFIYEVYKEKLFSPQEAGGLIGLAFRINSAGMIFSSDVMTNSGYVVPKNRVLQPGDSLFDYFQVSTHLSLFNYLNEYLYPHIQRRKPGLSHQDFIESLSLKSIGGYLASKRTIGMMTNADDFLLTPADLDYLRSTFGERARIYPRGGHLGNIEYRENLAAMIAFFSS